MRKLPLAVAGIFVALTALPSLADDGTDTQLRTRRTDLLTRVVPAPTAPVATAAVPAIPRVGAVVTQRVAIPELAPEPLPVVDAEVAAPDGDVSLQLGPITEIPGLVMRDTPLLVGTPSGEVMARIRQETAALVMHDLPVTQH